MHCYCSPQTYVLAHLCLGYAIACVIYLLLTKSLGTPFKDSLTEAQMRIKRHSVRKRGYAFLMSSILSAALLAWWKPLSDS
jgi:hypothetical protein